MRILLGVTGSVATTLTPKLVTALQQSGHEVRVVATQSSLYFFNPDSIGAKVWLEKDEWPNPKYIKDEAVGHIVLREWADALLIAPLTANTLGKMAHGLCDNLLTCVFRAWKRERPVVLAPAMNTGMWEHPHTARNAQNVLELNNYGYNIKIVPPIKKMLACGEEGVGALADIGDIVRALE